jgi:helix-turn-helix protein
MSADRVARQMWTLFEPVHAVTYFSAEGRSAFEEAGLRGFWRGYFAGRAAPLGRVGAAAATASFFVFAPGMVGRALPGVWDTITPEDALKLRRAGAVAALGRLLDGLDDAVTVSADMLAIATAGLDCSGRVLAGANATLPVPDEPLARLWHTCTVLREHRGEGHFAALAGAGLDGCETTVFRAGLDMPREMMQPLRGWSDQDWDAAAARLVSRGLTGADGKVTPAGAALHDETESRTDAAAAGPWADTAFAADLAEVMLPLARACAAELPFASPSGVPAPVAAGAGCSGAQQESQ